MDKDKPRNKIHKILNQRNVYNFIFQYLKSIKWQPYH